MRIKQGYVRGQGVMHFSMAAVREADSDWNCGANLQRQRAERTGHQGVTRRGLPLLHGAKTLPHFCCIFHAVCVCVCSRLFSSFLFLFELCTHVNIKFDAKLLQNTTHSTSPPHFTRHGKYSRARPSAQLALSPRPLHCLCPPSCK